MRKVVGSWKWWFVKIGGVGNGESNVTVGLCGVFGGMLVFAGLVQVAFVHWNGLRWVLTDEFGCEFGPCCKMSGINCLAPGGECRREAAGMIVSDTVGDGRIGTESVVDVE
jgi:hypothetical protein